jgi:hypothetical protein
VQALSQLNQRLCEENAWQLVELGKWEAGHNQKQVAFAAAAAEQAKNGLMASDSSSTAGKLPGAAVAVVLGRASSSNSGNVTSRTSRSSGSGAEQDGAAGYAAETSKEQSGVTGQTVSEGEAAVGKACQVYGFIALTIVHARCVHCLPSSHVESICCTHKIM